MSYSSLHASIEAGESPVLTHDRARAAGERIMRIASAHSVTVAIDHTVRSVTRIANNRILSSDTDDDIRLTITAAFGQRAPVSIRTNQLDDATLRAVVARVEALAREQDGSPWNLHPTPLEPQLYVPVALWHASTVEALRDAPEPIRSDGFVAFGTVGLMARSAFVMRRGGVESYYRETDCECTVTARSSDGRASGWHGQASRDWSHIRPRDSAIPALDIAKRSVGAQGLEPGRRTVVLSPFAVLQVVAQMMYAFDAQKTDYQQTPFSRAPDGNKLGLHVFDRRVTLSSAPDDPDGGYRPEFLNGLPDRAMTWVNEGILQNLQYTPNYGATKGKPYANAVASLRMSGGTTSIEQMIASCEQGIYVNRLSSVDVLDASNGMMTGVTRDGCFFIKNGKIEKPVKNFRFTDSPWFMLNKIVALGPPVRAPFGYVPPKFLDELNEWPRRPIIVPPMMVEDFNFSAIADAV
jgi:predicted Zn-dependent protease